MCGKSLLPQRRSLLGTCRSTPAPGLVGTASRSIRHILPGTYDARRVTSSAILEQAQDINAQMPAYVGAGIGEALNEEASR